MSLLSANSNFLLAPNNGTEQNRRKNYSWQDEFEELPFFAV